MIKAVYGTKAAEEPPLRWTLRQAAREFDVAKDTLRRRLGECHQQPAADGTYTTRQLTEAIYVDLYGAKLRTQNEKAEKLRIENEVSRGELLNRRELARGFAQIAEAISARIMSCTELPRAELLDRYPMLGAQDISGLRTHFISWRISRARFRGPVPDCLVRADPEWGLRGLAHVITTPRAECYWRCKYSRDRSYPFGPRSAAARWCRSSGFRRTTR